MRPANITNVGLVIWKVLTESPPGWEQRAGRTETDAKRRRRDGIRRA